MKRSNFNDFSANLTVLMNGIWREFVKLNYCQGYPGDFWVHDRETILQLEMGESADVRYYDQGSHLLSADVKRYFKMNPGAFGGEDNVVLRFTVKPGDMSGPREGGPRRVYVVQKIGRLRNGVIVEDEETIKIAARS